MTDDKWAPDDSFHDIEEGEYKGVTRVRTALAEIEHQELGDSIVTSRDPGMDTVRDKLMRTDMPNGVRKWQLPFAPNGNRPAFMFITECEPNAVVPEHVHDGDSIFRVILTGSIHFGDQELRSGDWIYIPRRATYSYVAGDHGALIFHEYPGE